MRELLLPVTAALLATAVPAMAAEPAPRMGGSPQAPADEEVRVPFGSIRNFRPLGDDVVYLEATGRRWYRAELNGPCITLPAALRVGYDPRYTGSSLDNSATLYVEGEWCRITSLTRAADPPPRRPRH